MGVGMEHAPLAIFTTLAPMAAASFVVLAYVFLAGKPSAEEAKRLDKWTALPAVFMALGMIASFFHLANPMNALFVFSGVGSSPLSNVLLVTVVFAVVALQSAGLAYGANMGGQALRQSDADVDESVG